MVSTLSIAAEVKGAAPIKASNESFLAAGSGTLESWIDPCSSIVPVVDRKRNER